MVSNQNVNEMENIERLKVAETQLSPLLKKVNDRFAGKVIPPYTMRVEKFLYGEVVIAPGVGTSTTFPASELKPGASLEIFAVMLEDEKYCCEISLSKFLSTIGIDVESL